MISFILSGLLFVLCVISLAYGLVLIAWLFVLLFSNSDNVASFKTLHSNIIAYVTRKDYW